MDPTSYSHGPPGGPPPMPPVYASRPRSQTGAGWKIAVFVLVVLLGFSAMLHLLSFVSSLAGGWSSAGSGHHKTFQENVLEDNDSHNKIAVISVEGLIMDGQIGGAHRGLVRWIRDQLEAAGNDPLVKAAILKVDSPGGEVLASDEISRAIQKFQEDYDKPVIASMGGLAASGGYYISAPCRWIVANDLTITGSIGVIMQSFNYRGLMDKIGLRPEVFKSGKFKDMMSGSKQESEITDEERAMIQRLVDRTFERFKEVVRTGRDRSLERNQAQGGDPSKALADNWENFADGRILSGTEAFEQGFVDELGTFETAVARAREITGINSANLIHYQEIFDLGQLFHLFSKAESSTRVQVDLGLDSSPIRAGRLYFLSPSYLR